MGSSKGKSWGEENCRICHQHCHWSQHKNLPHKYNIKRVKVTKTAHDLKARYEQAQGNKMTAEEIIFACEDEFDVIQYKVVVLTDMIRKTLERLSEIALKPNPLSTADYIDILIRSEEMEAKPGWQERVEQYKAVRKQAETMQKLAKDGFNPFEKYNDIIEQKSKKRSIADGRMKVDVVKKNVKVWNKPSTWLS
jgi:hypothetical protein